MNDVFIYKPKSGDRVFAINMPECGIRVVKWPNGCRHVQGGVHLSWRTSQPANHWREAARSILTSLVCQVGGIAWDDRGHIHVVVPVQEAMKVAYYMDLTSEAANCEPNQKDTHRNMLALVIGGASRLLVEADGMISAESIHPFQRSIRHLPLPKYGDLSPVRVFGEEYQPIDSLDPLKNIKDQSEEVKQ